MPLFARSRARLAVLATASLAVATAFAVIAAAPADASMPSAEAAKKGPKRAVPPITISGTVYTFDNQGPIAGATVRVAELPGLSASSGPDGRYSLAIPGGTRFTPYADAPGHHRIYLQTFVSQGKDLGGVNFQMPTEGAYNLLAAIGGAPRDENNELVNCAVVSTFSTANVRDVSFPDFVAYGAHGVAGATAAASPALPKPIYFNESVIPDATRTFSSVDGGVVWPVIPAGVYRFTAWHPSTRFAPFRATCAPGRAINANPTRGFYELRPSEQVDTSVDAELARARFDGSGRRDLVKVRVRAGEYVAVSARLTTGDGTWAERATKGYAPGKRSLKLPVRSVLAGRRVVVRALAEDGEGNVASFKRIVRIPAS